MKAITVVSVLVQLKYSNTEGISDETGKITSVERNQFEGPQY